LVSKNVTIKLLLVGRLLLPKVKGIFPGWLRYVLALVATRDTSANAKQAATAALSSPPRLSSTTFFISFVFFTVISFAKTSATMYPPGSGIRFTVVSGSGPPLHFIY
jgi:hypothetical protein